MDNDSIVYTNSDKGLGICAIEFKNYVQWGLKHLTNKTYYEFMTEEQAWTEILQLRQNIFQWTVDSRGEVVDEVVECIRESMDKSMKDPFAYFVVVPKIHKPEPMGSKTRGSPQTVAAYHTRWDSELMKLFNPWLRVNLFIFLTQ